MKPRCYHFCVKILKTSSDPISISSIKMFFLKPETTTRFHCIPSFHIKSILTISLVVVKVVFDDCSFATQKCMAVDLSSKK